MKIFRRIFKISKESNTKIKSVYLQAFREKYGNAMKPNLAFAFRFRYFVRGAGAGIAFMLIFFAFSTYADQQNVGTSSILYPLKRSQETVRMTLTGAADQPALHLEFAQRRLNEIQEIRAINPESPQIKTLSNELKNEVINSVATIKEDIIKFQNSLSGNSQTQDSSVISAPDPITAPSQNGDSAALTSPAAAPTSKIQIPPKPIDNKFKNKEKENNFIKSGEREKNYEKSAAICESWSEIMGSNEQSIDEIILKEPNLIAHFNQKCGGSIQFPKIQIESGESDSGD